MKKIVSVCVMIAMIFVLYVPAFAYLAGDSDGNGKVNAADARFALRVAAKLENASEEMQKICDVNSDGKVNASDARTILRMAAKLEAEIEIQTGKYITLNTDASTAVLKPGEIYDAATKFTCEVLVFNDSQIATSRGTGFFVTADGVVVTNYHVVKGAKKVVVKLGNVNYSVTSVLGYDAGKDIAILQTSAENVEFATVNTSYSVGDTVYTLGNPKGYENTFASGNISFAERIVADKNNGVKYIQFTSPSSKGSSGGPLLDECGNVIGVVSMTHEDAQNINFAVPCNEISKTDVSNPLTLEVFAAEPNSFNGTVVMSVEGITVQKDGAAVIYSIASANEDYTLVCKTDNDNATVYTDGSYGNVHPVYVFGNESGTTQVTVYFEGHETFCASFFVTVT